MVDRLSTDPWIPYGRGGAGNMRRKSSIRDAWFKISSQPDQHHASLTSRAEEPYASSKSERHTSTSRRRRSTNSSLWSTSTAAGEHRSAWRRLFRRKESVDEKEEIEEASS
ncbi:hypothetical protein FB567DRAFT_168063 [Paraphoma chrysanthemicola]|uniref:Uncharacterized protein n=1 Tax=Paraphoma chrysanthemicola TaxID=798071 RepID=A0A8K0RGS9_9PLEO|nr:hypothetical protein FB567DRAFT_168063 [Paraphoma chrysanthemicola]